MANPISPSRRQMWAVGGWAGSLLATAIVTSLATSAVERQKLVDQSISQQKVAEVGAFLNSSQEFYPVVADFVQEVKASKGAGSPAQKRLVDNLNQQYSALEASASYLSPDARSVAIDYQADLVILIKTARATNGPLDAKPFVNALSDALPRRCKVTRSLRVAAKLPSSTLDPSCDPERSPA